MLIVIEDKNGKPTLVQSDEIVTAFEMPTDPSMIGIHLTCVVCKGQVNMVIEETVQKVIQQIAESLEMDYVPSESRIQVKV